MAATNNSHLAQIFQKRWRDVGHATYRILANRFIDPNESYMVAYTEIVQKGVSDFVLALRRHLVQGIEPSFRLLELFGPMRIRH